MAKIELSSSLMVLPLSAQIVSIVSLVRLHLSSSSKQHFKLRPGLKWCRGSFNDIHHIIKVYLLFRTIFAGCGWVVGNYLFKYYYFVYFRPSNRKLVSMFGTYINFPHIHSFYIVLDTSQGIQEKSHSLQ